MFQMIQSIYILFITHYRSLSPIKKKKQQQKTINYTRQNGNLHTRYCNSNWTTFTSIQRRDSIIQSKDWIRPASINVTSLEAMKRSPRTKPKSWLNVSDPRFNCCWVRKRMFVCNVGRTKMRVLVMRCVFASVVCREKKTTRRWLWCICAS